MTTEFEKTEHRIYFLAGALSGAFVASIGWRLYLRYFVRRIETQGNLRVVR